jgi:hypothetical protein
MLRTLPCCATPISLAISPRHPSPAHLQERRWELTPYALPEWQAWVAAQKKAADITSDALYVQVQLDGSVRSSGVGQPPWAKFVEELPELDSIQTRLTDGIGMSQ